MSRKVLVFSPTFSFLFLFVCFWPHHTACRMLVPRLETEPRTPAVRAPSSNCWSAREFPLFFFSKCYFLGWLVTFRSTPAYLPFSVAHSPLTIFIWLQQAELFILSTKTDCLAVLDGEITDGETEYCLGSSYLCFLPHSVSHQRPSTLYSQ